MAKESVYMSKQQVADFLGKSPRWVYRTLIHERLVEAVKIGNEWLVKRESLMRFIAAVTRRAVL